MNGSMGCRLARAAGPDSSINFRSTVSTLFESGFKEAIKTLLSDYHVLRRESESDESDCRSPWTGYRWRCSVSVMTERWMSHRMRPCLPSSTNHRQSNQPMSL